MFTGIIEEIGEIASIDVGANSIKLGVKCNRVLSDTKVGDSISVNGVCLTVVSFSNNQFVADVMPETLAKSSLGSQKVKDRVNLERAMMLNGRFGGHIVTGHIDGVGRIINRTIDDNSVIFTILSQPDITKYIVKKGSVALDGISLTVSYVKDNKFKVSIIPHTLEKTCLMYKGIGDEINIECDIIGKYIEKLSNHTSGGITYDFLEQNGFM